VETVASWARIRSDRRSDVDEEKGRFSVADRRRLQALGLSQTATLALATHALEGGWEARRYDADFDYFARRRPEILIFGPYAARRPRRRTFEGPLRGEHVGAWLREVRTWGELTGELGLRYDHHDATGDDLLSPRLSAAWRPAAPLLLRLAWGRFFQSQRPYELGVADGETRLRAAERSDQWVVGLEAAPPSRATHLPAVRLEVYHRRVDDPRPRFESLLEPVNFFPEIEPDRALIVPRSSREQGVELLVRGARTPPGLARGRLGWWLAYAWSRAVDEVGGRDVPRPLDQPHTLTLACDLRLPREWQLDLAWRWHTGWPTTPVTPLVPDEESDTATAVFGTLAGERLPTYHRLDLRASRRWPTRRGSFGFFVDAQNVYARRNQAGFDVVLDDDGRVRLDRELWPGIVPSLGVTWQIGE
jgi:outer membrane receptor protein involved in Fe transport